MKKHKGQYLCQKQACNKNKTLLLWVGWAWFPQVKKSMGIGKICSYEFWSLSDECVRLMRHLFW